jgi:hypothetical protein
MNDASPAKPKGDRIQSFSPLTSERERPKRHRQGGAFLGGAIGRLLPWSIPFRYFGAAAVFQVLAWLALVAGAGDATRFRGGLGLPLAALHLITLGVLVMTAIGASMQLLPVATRQAVHWRHAPASIWWLYTPGVAVLAAGMALPQPLLLALGAVLVAIALAIYAVVLAQNLFGARGMPAVVAHGWVAWVALVIVVIAGVSLAFTYVGGRAIPRSTALALHVPFAAYGFMGMLALGLSYIVVPMFALSHTPDDRMALVSCGLAAAALGAAALAAFGVAVTAARAMAIVLGAAAVALYVHAMLHALRTGMRRELGPSFRLVRLAWAWLAASLVIALAIVVDLRSEALATLFGFTLIVGWLLTFLLGILQRIVPFLASMHAVRGKHLPPTPAALGGGAALPVHHAAYLAALALVTAAIAFDSGLAMRVGALSGLASAVAFLVFFATVVLRTTRANTAARTPVATA